MKRQYCSGSGGGTRAATLTLLIHTFLTYRAKITHIFILFLEVMILTCSLMVVG